MSHITVLRRLLRSLCHNTKWNYAVFWRLKQQDHVILTWEESYIDSTIASNKVEGPRHDESIPVHRPRVIYPSFAKEAQYGTTCSVKTAVLNLQCHQYPLGEGIIGKVALTQRHHWIFAGELDSDLLSEHHEDWQLQFAAGIKTILLVPIRHLGVLQLGSLDMVMEDPMLVIQIEELFGEPLRYSGITDVSGTSFDCLDVLSLDEHLSGINSASIIDLLNPTQSQQPFDMDPDILFPSLDDNISQMLDSDEMRNDSLLDPAATSCLLDSSNNMLQDVISVTDNETKVCFQPNVAYCGSNLKQFSCHSAHEVHAVNGVLNRNEMTLQEAKEEHNFVAQSLTNCRLRGHANSSTHKVLGYATIEENDSSFSNTTVLKAEESVLSTTIFQRESCEQSFDQANAHLTEESDAGYLLDALLSSLQGTTTDDEIEELILQSCKTSSDKFMEPSTFGKRDFSILGLTDSMLSRQSKDEETTTNSGSKRICRSKHEYTDPAANVYIGRKLSESTKRKDDTGTAQKPRPRDRQLIQDRIKELRELIPHGGKCSIDELLYKTVRHMLFLQSVSVQAKKLRESANLEDIADWNSMNSQSCPPQNQPQDCPLIFKNLHQPGQILVEMLCKDYALFSEIVHTIRRLELAILTGALQSRRYQGEDVLWAHFIIEVPSGFNRVNILWPLMQLLQQNHARLCPSVTDA